MKTKLLFFTLLISSLSFAQYTAIPDPNFENALSAYDDIANDGQVPTGNINMLTTLDVQNQNITDLTGIEDFTALTHLYCNHNQLSSLDVSQNTNLTELYCHNNQLTSLNVNQNTNLSKFWCSNNQLTSVDVSQNINLTQFMCANNPLTGLDISQNTNLIRLWCFNDTLGSLDVSQNVNLTHLICFDNSFGSLDVSQNINLIYLQCYDNQLNNLDVSNNTNLTELRCNNNQLTSLNVANGNNNIITYFNATNNPNLFCIEVDDDAYSTINWTSIDPQSNFSTDCDAAGVDESTFNKVVTIYPNPVNHTLNLSAQDQIKNVSIYNVTGQEVINMQANAAEVQIDMSRLQKGIYFVKAQINGQVTTLKVVKE